MAQDFTLRLITRQAGGGEIVRTRRVEWHELTIGRAADNDVVLSDLTLDLHHARITRTAPGRVLVEASDEFLVDGRSSQRADLDVASRPVLGFGAFELAIEPGEGEGEVAVTVTRQEEDDRPSVSLFSLRAAVFGRRRMAWIYALLVVALCLVLPIAGAVYMDKSRIHTDRQWSAGPLSQSHAFLEDDCQACHQKAFVAVRDETCLTCHQADGGPADLKRIEARLKETGAPVGARLVAAHASHDRLLRGTPRRGGPGGLVTTAFRAAFNHPSDRCASCHLEHTAPIPAKADAATDKVERPERPALVMAEDCAGCHAGLKARLPSTTLADTPDWGRHPGFRPLVTLSAEGAKPQVRRIAVSARPVENSGLIFPHRLHMDPTGGVARQALELGVERGYGGALACASCHRGDKRGAGFRPIEMERDCGACHSLAFARSGGELQFLPHDQPEKVLAALAAYYGGGAATGQPQTARRRPGAFAQPGSSQATATPALASGAFRAAFSPGGACHDCHTISWTPAEATGVRVARVHLVERFLPAGGFDHSVPAHRGQGQGAAACADCHKAASSDRAQDFLIPDIGKCGTCHGKTGSQTPAAASADCQTCHSFHAPGRAAQTPQDRLLEAIRGSWDVAPALRP